MLKNEILNCLKNVKKRDIKCRFVKHMRQILQEKISEVIPIQDNLLRIV